MNTIQYFTLSDTRTNTVIERRSSTLSNAVFTCAQQVMDRPSARVSSSSSHASTRWETPSPQTDAIRTESSYNSGSVLLSSPSSSSSIFPSPERREHRIPFLSTIEMQKQAERQRVERIPLHEVNASCPKQVHWMTQEQIQVLSKKELIQAVRGFQIMHISNEVVNECSPKQVSLMTRNQLRALRKPDLIQSWVAGDSDVFLPRQIQHLSLRQIHSLTESELINACPDIVPHLRPRQIQTLTESSSIQALLPHQVEHLDPRYIRYLSPSQCRLIKKPFFIRMFSPAQAKHALPRQVRYLNPSLHPYLIEKNQIQRIPLRHVSRLGNRQVPLLSFLQLGYTTEEQRRPLSPLQSVACVISRGLRKVGQLLLKLLSSNDDRPWAT